MPGVKISNLPASATPLSGTEILPIVKSGSTVQVSVDNLTAGRAINVGSINTTSSISAASLSLTTTPLNIASGGTNGAATPTAGSVAVGTGTALSYTTAGTSGQLLKSAGAGTPTWITTIPIANGGTNATTASITSFNNITGYLASGATGTTSTNLVFSASPTFTGTLAASAITASSNVNITAGDLTVSGLSAASKVLTGGPTTTSYNQSLQIYGGSFPNGPQNTFHWSYNNYSAAHYFINTRGTTATAFTTLVNGDTLGNLGFAGTNGTAVTTTANIIGVLDGAVTAVNFPTALAFYTGITGGLLTLNLASSRVVTMPGYGSGSAVFSAGGVISSTSDETYKIKDGVVADPIAMIMALEPGYYFGKPEANMGPGRQLGFYAQNVRAAIGPEAAPDPESTTAEDGTVTTKPWGYFDRSVLAVAVDAIKVQQAQIIALTARIEALEART